VPWTLHEFLFVTTACVKKMKNKKEVDLSCVLCIGLISGDPLLDIIPLYLDVLRGDASLLKKFLESYALPFSKVKDRDTLTNRQLEESKLNRISYRAM
jgi:hypothetical protein